MARGKPHKYLRIVRGMRTLSKVIAAALVFGATSLPSAHAAPIYTFPVVGCKVVYAHSHHNYPATDILAKKGCKIVAPTSGIIDEVSKVDTYKWNHPIPAVRGGLSFSMIGDDGVRYYGSHLSFIQPTIVSGARVNVGDLIGRIGDSGDARGTAPHLHFGISWPTPKNIWWVRRGELYPWPFLDAWRAGRDLSPASSVKKLEKKVGRVPKHLGY